LPLKLQITNHIVGGQTNKHGEQEQINKWNWWI